MEWDGINLHLEHLATALMKEITVAWPSTTSHDQQCSHMQHFRIVGEGMLLFESISWGGTSNRRKGLQQTHTIANFNEEF